MKQKRFDGEWVKPNLTDEEEEWLQGMECPICGADYGVSNEYPWHWPHEDCRAVRPPINLDCRDCLDIYGDKGPCTHCSLDDWMF